MLNWRFLNETRPEALRRGRLTGVSAPLGCLLALLGGSISDSGLPGGQRPKRQTR
jgi:hypothetical protein